MTLVPQVISLPKAIKSLGNPYKKDHKRWSGLPPHCADLQWSFLPCAQEALGVAGSQGQTLLLVSAPVLTFPSPQCWLAVSCSCCSHLLNGKRPLAPPLFQSSEGRLLVNIFRVSD